MYKNALFGPDVRRKSCRIIFSFWLASSLIWFSPGLAKDAFASQKILKIRKNIIEKLGYVNKVKAYSINIEGGLEESLAEEKITSKVSGDLGFFIKSKVRLPKIKAYSAIELMTPQLEQERLNVIFELSPGGIDLNKLTSRGIIIKNQHKNLIEVEVQLQNIERIVEEFDEILYVRSPKKFFPLEVTSEGVSLSGATAFHQSGYKGQGVKVAVIDVGFKGLSAAQANGDLPYSAIEQDYTGTDLQTQYKHGTGCAEIVYDMAPDAQLYLIKIEDEMDFYNALDYCINENIDIISSSLGTFGSGPGDGTGSVCEAADEIRENGILPINAAGNSATSTGDGVTVGFHWKGTFRDTNADNIHEFDPYDPESIVNAVGGMPAFDDDGNPETDEIAIILRWNNWPNATVDYDLYLFDEDGNLVDSSTGTQNGSQPPLETIVYDVPSSSVEGEVYYLVVAKKAGEPSGVELELFSGGNCFFWPYVTPPSSICEPADAESVLAVGAIDQANWTTGPQEDFSSQGPTNAWAGSTARVKPDICGPDGISGYTYGTTSFYGTSAATPHVAGAATLILSANTSLTADQLQTILEDNAIDMGASGKDNLFGSGRLNLPQYITQEKGDINNDGKVNSADAIRCLRFAVGLDDPTPAERYAADMNDDGKINSADAIKILRKAVGLE